MAYMDQKRKQVISENLKPVLKKYGFKGSLKVRHHMGICLTLQSGSLDFKAGSNINPYWIDSNYEKQPKHKEFLNECLKALKSAGYYNNSDAMTDYFDTAYYYDLEISDRYEVNA